MKKTRIRIGSRESALAMAQSKWIIQLIRERYPDLNFELVGIKTLGDHILDSRLEKVGGKGLFIKELEQALLYQDIDMAVHSMKDIPADIPEGLVIAAVSKREDPRDVLISSQGMRLEDLAPGAIIGTSSMRREVQILEKRPDLKVKTLRGNVLTRINKLLINEFDAIVLAAAGLKRLGLEEYCKQYFETRDMIPAVGQGALAVETRKGDPLVKMLMNSIHSENSALAVAAERAFMIKLNGGCITPIAAHAVVEGTSIKVDGMFIPPNQTTVYRGSVEGNPSRAVELGEELAVKLLELSKRGKCHD